MTTEPNNTGTALLVFSRLCLHVRTPMKIVNWQHGNTVILYLLFALRVPTNQLRISAVSAIPRSRLESTILSQKIIIRARLTSDLNNSVCDFQKKKKQTLGVFVCFTRNSDERITAVGVSDHKLKLFILNDLRYWYRTIGTGRRDGRLWKARRFFVIFSEERKSRDKTYIKTRFDLFWT